LTLPAPRVVERQIVVVIEGDASTMAERIDELRGPLRIVSASHAPTGRPDVFSLVLVLEGNQYEAMVHERKLREVLT
jgi:hypothetical protein